MNQLLEIVVNNNNDIGVTQNKKECYLKTSINILSMGDISNETNFVDCNFNLKCVYCYISEEDRLNEKSVFMIEN